MTATTEESTLEGIPRFSAVPLVDWRFHGVALHAMLAMIVISAAVSTNQTFFWFLIAGFSFYGLLLGHFTLMSPRMVRYDSNLQMIGVYWEGEWEDFPMAGTELRLGVRRHDTCGWFAGKVKCLIIHVPNRHIDRGRLRLVPASHRYRFAVGESDSEIRKWRELLGDSGLRVSD